MSHVHVIHENQEWTAPLYQQLEALGVPYQDWFLNEGTLDLSKAPPEGVFYNRMSASSHTRGHRYSAEFTGAVLAWLERHGRRVLNSSGALRLEISKVAQYAALEDHGIRTPRTVATLGRTASGEASSPSITATRCAIGPPCTRPIISSPPATSSRADRPHPPVQRRRP